MGYQVTCEDDNYNEVFDDSVDALIEYNSHNRKGHTVSMVPVGESSYETLKKDLNDKGIYNGAFRITQNPLGLSYSVPTGGSLRAHKAILADNTNPPENPPKSSKYNFYFERLVKLVPSEILGLYLALYSLGMENIDANGIEKIGVNEDYTKWISIVCLILVFVSRIFGTKITGYNTFKYFKTAQWKSIIISAISFVIWIYAMGHTFAGIDVKEQLYIKATVILWTFVIPILYKGED